jgi:trans-aconitate methyltransferase
MGLQVVCVDRKGKQAGHRHVSAVGVSTSEVVIRFSVKTVRRILKRGTVDFYCIGPDGSRVSLRRYKCRCGAKTVRTGDDDLADGVLSELPTCPRPGPVKATGLFPAEKITEEGGRGRYAFGDSEAAADRLALLAEVFEPPSRSLLEAADLGEVGVAIDLGCGPGYSTRLVAGVRPGILIGIDASAAFLEEAGRRGPRAARWHLADVTEGPLPGAPADLLFARLVLAHLASPESILTTWLGQLRPGGHLLVEEDEAIVSDHPLLAAYEELAGGLVAQHGGDMCLGARLAVLAPPPGYRKAVDRLYALEVPAPVAARLFAMNFSVWRDDPWVATQRSAAELDTMGHELRAVAASSDDRSVTFSIRQIAYRRDGGRMSATIDDVPAAARIVGP